MTFADCAQISWLFKPKKHPGYHSALKLGCLQLALSNEPRNTIMFKKKSAVYNAKHQQKEK